MWESAHKEQARFLGGIPSKGKECSRRGPSRRKAEESREVVKACNEDSKRNP